MSALEFVALAVLVALNGFFSFAESVVLLSSRNNLESMAEEGGSKAAARVLALKDDPERFFSTIQIAVIVAIAAISVVSFLIAVRWLAPVAHAHANLAIGGSIALCGASAILASTFLVASFGTLLPRALGRIASDRISAGAGMPVVWASAILAPFRWAMIATSRGALLALGKKRDRDKIAFTTDELRELLLKEGRDSGMVENPDNELIHSVFEFSDIDVRDIMVPKHKINSIRTDTPPEGVLKHVVESGFSRYPVYRASLDDTVGMLYNKDLLALLEKRKAFTIKEIVRPIHFVPEKTKVSDVLKDMQLRRMNMVMVVNEFGSVVGLVTIEDAVEEIVGEMSDENEVDEEQVKLNPDGSMLIDASVAIRELESDYGLPLEESDEYDTLAGFMIATIDNIPKGGETVRAEGYQYTIVNMERRRISLVKAERIAE